MAPLINLSGAFCILAVCEEGGGGGISYPSENSRLFKSYPSELCRL
jgi:hypothetical protein